MLSKKQALVLGAVAIAGTGIGLMVLGDKDDNGGEAPLEETKKEMLIRYDAPVYAPSEIYAPYSEKSATEIIHNVITYVLPPTPPPIPDTMPAWAKKDILVAQVEAQRGGITPPPDPAAHHAATRDMTTAEKIAYVAVLREAVETSGSGGSGGSGGGRVTSKKSVSTPKATAKATTRRTSLRERARAASQ